MTSAVRQTYILAAALALFVHGAAFMLYWATPSRLILERSRPQSVNLELVQAYAPTLPAQEMPPGRTPQAGRMARPPVKKNAGANPAVPARPKTTPAGTLDSAVTPPTPLASADNTPPEYPLLARKRGQEGTVLLMVQVDAKGRVKSADVAQSSGHRLLDEAALRAVLGWNFIPARRGGHPVADSAIIPLEFRLTALQN